MKEIINQLIPPLIGKIYRQYFIGLGKQNYGLSGDYSSWNEAVAANTGYDTDLILEKTKAALLKIKNGEAIYERDSVLFNEIQYTWPLLAGLMWIAAQITKKKLRVLQDLIIQIISHDQEIVLI